VVHYIPHSTTDKSSDVLLRGALVMHCHMFSMMLLKLLSYFTKDLLLASGVVAVVAVALVIAAVTVLINSNYKQ
jgi:hypothetical protein